MTSSAEARRRSWFWLGVSLLLTLTAAVPVAWITFPHLYRWRMLQRLASPDLAQRQRALAFVAARAPRDEAVLRGALARLGGLDDVAFTQLAEVLQWAGLWSRPPVPDDAWLRWIRPLWSEANPDARILGAQRLADLHDLATDPRVVEGLRRLANDPQAAVRLNALVASAELAGAARHHGQDPSALDQIILDATRDPEPRIAREAFMFVGLLQPASGVSADWQAADPEVAIAIRWAAGLERFEPVPAPEGQSEDPLVTLHWLESLPVGAHRIDIPPDMPDMLRLAAVAVTAEPRLSDLRRLFNHEEPSMRDLACVVAVDRFDAPALTDLAGELLRSFDDRDKMSGAILCGLAGVRPRATLVDVSTAAPLREVDLLRYRLEHEDVWQVQQVFRLATAMRGEPVPGPEGNPLDIRQLSAALLSMPDHVPLTTVMLAMLHLRDPAVLEFMLSPRTDERIDLLQLLDQQRWWRVLRRHLPAHAVALDGWADPQIKRFQVDLLRNWYLVHRVAMREAWNMPAHPTRSQTDGEAGPE